MRGGRVNSENDLLRIAAAHEEYCREAASALDAAVSVCAFGALCLLLWAALHLGAV